VLLDHPYKNYQLCARVEREKSGTRGVGKLEIKKDEKNKKVGGEKKHITTPPGHKGILTRPNVEEVCLPIWFGGGGGTLKKGAGSS